MLRERVAERYAVALLTVARDKGLVREVAADLKNIAGATQDNEELRRFLRHPRIARTAKKALLDELFSARIQQLTLNLLTLLAFQRRFDGLPLVRAVYQRLVEQAQGIARAAVVSAVASA